MGLFFGSFNPIHSGHLIVLRYWLNEASLDAIWLIVSPHNPHKSLEELAPAADRLQMARLAVEGEKRLLVSDVEFALPTPSYTIETLRYLQMKYPSYQWRILIGADAFASVPSWKEAKTLLSDYVFWIYPRKSYHPVNLTKNCIFFSEAPRVDLSATQVRNYLKKQQSIRFLVPPAVESYIYDRGLYGTNKRT